jgi:hypothetical protein
LICAPAEAIGQRGGRDRRGETTDMWRQFSISRWTKTLSARKRAFTTINVAYCSSKNLRMMQTIAAPTGRLVNPKNMV